MKTLPRRIVGTGLFALDVIVSPDGAVTHTALGGSAGNVLSILAALGWNASPMGTLGDDVAACKVHDSFRAVGADLEFMRRSSDRCTPVIYQHQLASHEAGTHRFSFACPTCGQYRRPRWDDATAFCEDLSTLPPARVFFLDRPTPLGVTLAEHYRGAGSLVVFEPSAIGDDAGLFARAVRSAHVIKYADDRMDDLSDFDTRTVSIEIQTCGSRGLRFRAPSLDNAWVALGAYELPHVGDTAGAGDWCTAGLIYDLFNGNPSDSGSFDYKALTRALAFGQALSTLNCLTEGAQGLLEAWSPDKIVRSARKLRTLRLRSFFKEKTNPSSSIHEPKLEEFAEDSRLRGTVERSGADDFACCLPL
ncbi:Sugar or nucleoside kinase, ribokinase family [Burkholderia sp. OK233]|jgi:hypothetical protein|nr:Sugar or nucleoside kinase, ribokinase family [Burkholderia sp. OK233]